MLKTIKLLIWLYLLLLVFEGALRKWVFPGLAEPLLIVRDPVVLAIYACAIIAGIVPRNLFMGALGGLVVLAIVFSLLAGQTNFLVTLYGIRTNFLHVPLIWVMGAVLTRQDAERLGLATLAMAVPMTLLMIEQFRAPIDAWINRGVGGDSGGQIYGAGGRIRPPGFFSFITGPMAFFPLAAAFFLQFIAKPLGGRLRWLFVLACGAAIVIAIPVSISRGTMITTGLVGAVFAATYFFTGVRAGGLLRFGIAAVILTVAISVLPIFREAREAFMDRWNVAANQVEGDAWASLGTRVASGFTTPLETVNHAPFFGYGIGVGSNVGAKLLAGKVGFLLAENEWDRCILELGPVLGVLFIGFRCAIAVWLLWLAFQALRQRRDALPLLIWTAASPVIVLQQWAPPTLLGFAVFGGGLLLASLNVPAPLPLPVEEPPPADIDDTPDDTEPPPPPPPSSELELRRRHMRGLV